MSLSMKYTDLMEKFHDKLKSTGEGIQTILRYKGEQSVDKNSYNQPTWKHLQVGIPAATWLIHQNYIHKITQRSESQQQRTTSNKSNWIMASRFERASQQKSEF